jgi:hypothetical protein
MQVAVGSLQFSIQRIERARHARKRRSETNAPADIEQLHHQDALLQQVDQDRTAWNTRRLYDSGWPR